MNLPKELVIGCIIYSCSFFKRIDNQGCFMPKKTADLLYWLLYSKICCIIIQIQALRTSLFLLLFVLVDTRRETQFLRAYANHTMLPLHARPILWCFSSQLISAGRDPKWSAVIRSDKHSRTLQRSNFNYGLFKILKFSGSSLPGATSTTHSIHSNGRAAPFPVSGFIKTDDDCRILSVWV